jgi:hypothetical protein
MCFGDIVNNICDDCKPFVLSFKFDARANNPNYSDVIKNQFKLVCGNALKENQEKGKKSHYILHSIVLNYVRKILI